MCTAISMTGKHHYFGRNLDLSYHYNESVTITPRKFPFHFSNGENNNSHYAMIGIATVVDDYPLYYDGTNECGLSIAALNFPGNAVYRSNLSSKVNIASYELIAWILSQCDNVESAKQLLANVNISEKAFRADLQPTPLHWMISDKNVSIVLEVTAEGTKVYDNPVGVLTNNPPFPFQLYNLGKYLNVTSQFPENRFSPDLNLLPYSLGMGSIGLPGDLSSPSRFVRAAFHLHNAVFEHTEDASVNAFFHILCSVAQMAGSVEDGGKFTKTVYSSCCNTELGIFYYTTYENTGVTAISMHNEDLDSTHLMHYPLRVRPSYLFEN